jgi:Ca2+-binding EF-hand superfamily protein
MNDSWRPNKSLEGQKGKIMKLQMTILSWVLALILVCVTGLAGAQVQSQDSETTESSPLKSCLKRFDAIDTKHTGKVTKDEFMAAKGSSARAEKIFSSRDLNRDGVVTKEEFCMGAGGAGAGKAQSDPAALCKSRFTALDANHDGVVTKEEYASGRKPGAKAEELFKQKDANGNGTLTSEEFCGAAGSGKPKSQSPLPAAKGGS